MYGFEHITSSPRYPQAIGEAERAVRTVKELLSKNEDPYLALLAYRSTPLENGYSPAQLLMGRRLKITVPVFPSQLKPKLPDSSELRGREKNSRNRQKRNYDRRHQAKLLKPLHAGDTVWIPDTNSEGTVVEMRNPRSYVVNTPDGGNLEEIVDTYHTPYYRWDWREVAAGNVCPIPLPLPLDPFPMGRGGIIHTPWRYRRGHKP